MPTLNRKTADKMSLKHYRRKMRWRIKAVNHSFQMPDYFAPLLEGRSEALILDVGSGPINMVGDTWPGCDVKIVCADGLATRYAELWSERDSVPHTPIEQQDMEALTYEDNSFDVVHCVNALDHTIDPLAALKELLRVVRPDGHVYLRHVENEAERMKYHGQHQWNITNEGKLWSQTEEHDLADYGFTTIMKTETANLDEYPFPEMVVSIR